MIANDVTNRAVTGTGCTPNGYGGSAATEYDPTGEEIAGGWNKSSSIYFATVIKLVTNSTTGARPADGSWRDHTTTDNQEGWIGKKVTIPPLDCGVGRHDHGRLG